LKATSLSFFFSGVLLLLVVAAIPRTASAATPTAGSTVIFQNANSKLCIDTGGSTNFPYLTQAPCSTSKTQQFTLKTSPASGWYYLVSSASNLCWDIWNGSSSAGALVQQYACTAVAPEYYQLIAVSGGYEILSQDLTNGCVDVVGASTASGANIEQNNCAGTASQVFTASVMSAPSITTQPASQTVTVGQAATFSVATTGAPPPSYQWMKNNVATSGATSSTYTTPATSNSDNGAQFTVVVSNAFGSVTSSAATLTVSSSSGSLPTAGSIITLRNTNSGLCIDTGGSTGFTPLIQSACSTSNTQQFTLTTSPTSGWYYLASAASHLCWDIAGGSLTAGALIQQYTCTAVSPEYYELKPVSGGYMILSGNMANGCVDVVGASTASGASMEQNTCTGAANQVFAASVVNLTGAQPQVSLVPSSVSFGNVVVGTTSTQTIKLTNSGTANLTVSQDPVSGNGFSSSGLALPLTLTPGQSTNFNVAFAPAAAGSVSGSFSLISNATNSPTALALSGAGAAPAPPSVAISSPANGAAVSGTITVSGTASDAVGVSSVQVQIDGGTFSPASGTTNWTFDLDTTALSNTAHTLTARATDTAGLTATSTVTVNVSNSGSTVNVTSYGATGNGSTDDTAAINNAIAALSSGSTLFFPCGTYKTSSQLTLNISNVTLDGGSCAVLHNTSSGAVMVIGGSGNGNPNYSPAVALSAIANELNTSFSTVSSLGVAAGDYIRLQQGGKDSSNGSGDTGCDPSGCRGEVLKVASVSSNTITVTTALHDTYNPSVNGATAQKILSPLTGMTVKNITFDGNGSNVYGLEIAGVAESSVTGITSRNVQGSALLNRGDFNVAWSNITVTSAGSAQCGSAVWFENQGNLSVNGLSISNENQGASGTGCLYNGAFGFELIASANSTITNLSVDAAGAYGRPFKTTAARYNTFNSPTVKNGVQAYNGISLEYYSSHNTYNTCTVTNNGAGTGTGTGNAGIITFGNFNQYNSFNNCTVSGNGNVQFYISGYDALRLAQDTHNTVSGGTFTGSNSVQAVLLIEGDGTYINGAIINGPGAQGIYLDTQASNACVNNNTFTLGSGLGTAISANSSGDLGFGNILNLLSSNLTAGTCSPPLP
jgi:hypothetical protein